MGIIENLKSSFSQNNYSKKISPYSVGLKIFQLGVIFLAAAPAVSFFLLLISSFLGGGNKKRNYFKDKYNYPFIIVAALMLINSAQSVSFTPCKFKINCRQQDKNKCL